MPHHAIIGETRSGKTVLARHLAQRVRDEGVYVAVLDPFYNEWPADFQTNDPKRMLDALPKLVATNMRWALFMDESSQSVDRYDPRFNFLATGAAQCGVVSYFIAQDAMQIHPQIRSNVENWWIFRQTPDQAKKLAKARGEPGLLEASTIPKLTFFLRRPFKPLMRGVITFHGKNVRVELKAA